MNKGLDAPPFFVPQSKRETQEEDYARLARICGCSPPLPGERIYSINFEHDGEAWTATVGEPLRGFKLIPPSRRARARGAGEREIPLWDPAVVIAIFPRVPYVVATTGGVVVHSAWANPFFVDIPRVVIPSCPTRLS